MAIIRRYGNLPALFVPDEGEIVYARRSPAGVFLKAVVLRVRRRLDHVRVDVEWLEGSDVTPTGRTVEAGTKGHMEIREGDPLPLIRRIPAA